ncbi:AraC family transcriptional regulator [Granulosicoccus sp. 3-233]|uniref:AraC family transcriptional regulator n=1 Tax=Granulosicoccus sp. 3-233 TaxID=3417969 RepID=UPI003D356D57
MASIHDQTSRSVAASSELLSPGNGFKVGKANALPLLCQENGKDPLSDVLQRIKLTGAVFHLVDATYPWGVEVPPARKYASIILPSAQHVVSYHIILKGSGWAIVPGMAAMRFEAGDILVLARGEPYSLLSSPEQEPEYDTEATIAFFQEWTAGRLPFVTCEGGGGEGGAEYLCGFLGCDRRPFKPVVSALPPLLRVRQTAGNDLLERLLELTLSKAHLPRAGDEAVRLRLCELIFLEVLRLCMETLPVWATGWLSGLRDPQIGKILSLLHERPAEAWNLQELASQAGMSRSAFSARFTHLVGYPPMQYLTTWRMQLAADLLADGSSKVAAVGREVGFSSESAFSRAFKKAFGVSPAQWRCHANPQA